MSRWDRLLVFAGLNLAALALFVVCFTLFPVLSLKPRKFAILCVLRLSYSIPHCPLFIKKRCGNASTESHRARHPSCRLDSFDDPCLPWACMRPPTLELWVMRLLPWTPLSCLHPCASAALHFPSCHSRLHVPSNTNTIVLYP